MRQRLAAHLCTTTRQLATLLEAGLPLVRALRTLQRQAKGQKPALFAVMGHLADAVEGGATFSEALATNPRTFNRLYVSMVRAGEASGAMEIVLVRLAEFMEKAQRIAGKVKSALVYPISVLVIALAITAGLMIFVIRNSPRCSRRCCLARHCRGLRCLLLSQQRPQRQCHRLCHRRVCRYFYFQTDPEDEPGAYALTTLP